MTKKGDTSSTKKIKRIKNKIISKEDRVLEKLLIENFISMQKVMSSLVIKFDGLSKKIEGLLTLFEDSAKSVAQKEINLELKGDTEKQEEVLEKLKLLLDQNKLIAKGITLVHDSNQLKEHPVITQKELNGGINFKPTSMEHDEKSINSTHINEFSVSKNTSPEFAKKTMEEEGLPPKPSFSI